MSVQSLQQQILAQGTTGKWSGEGYGSAAENALAMARILDGIGITDINQFGQFEKTTNQQQEVQREMGVAYGPEGDSYWTPTGNYYTADSDGNKTYVDPKYVTQGTRTVESGDGFVDQPVYTANVPVTQTVYGNKETQQAVPNTYSERQTGNAWGGTFAGSGNTGFRVEFAPNGTPYFYTTGASSSDVGGLIPIAALGLSLLAPGVGTAIGSALGASGVAASAIGNAIISGTLAEASGGDFAKGALTGAIGSGVGGLISPEISSALGGGSVGNVAANALTSGALSELQGGDFTSAALRGALTGGIDAAKAAAISDYISQNPLSNDYSVTTDYSLGSGASGEPGLSVAPIDTQYQVGSFDYSIGDLLQGLGLQMPTTPNIDSMGGGQGIVLKTTDGYITEQGFVPNSYVASLGDPESFINKPVIDIGLSSQQAKDTSASDLNAKIAGLDIAKALSPFALAALMKGAYDLASDEDATSGFAMVPVPSHWKSPEYNQAFTPSAPIDFGSNELLKGTQWETPSLSNVINTLNYQPVAYGQQSFAQPQQQFQVPDILQQFQSPSTVGMNDVVGNLDGKQVSISDIISGIQSQYG